MYPRGDALGDLLPEPADDPFEDPLEEPDDEIPEEELEVGWLTAFFPAGALRGRARRGDEPELLGEILVYPCPSINLPVSAPLPPLTQKYGCDEK